MSLDIPPGEVLTEVVLSEYYGASRTPIREAIKGLIIDAFIVSKQGVGNIVPFLSIDSYVEIYQLREVLEILSAKLASTNWDNVDLNKLKKNISQQKLLLNNPYAPLEFLQLDREFHLLLADISHNSHLRIQVENMYDLFFRYNYFCDFENRYSFAITEHERILDLIESRNAYAVQQEMKNHMTNINALILHRLAKRL